MLIYRNEEGPFTKKDFELNVEIPHPVVSSFATYKHCNLPLMGIGPSGPDIPFFYFDDLLDLTELSKIRHEVLNASQKKLIQFKQIVANGLIPTHFNNQKCIDSYLANLSSYALDEAWKNEILKLNRKGDIKIFFHNYFKINVAWDGIAMFRNYTGRYEDKTQPSSWLNLIEHFPRLKKFVEELPFKYIGYVMIFKSNGLSPVLTHRDYYPTNHTVNFINFRLDDASRPFFLFDSFNFNKTYIKPSARSYFFNEIDAHGLDQEEQSRLTLRVEGQFSDSFKDQLGLGKNDTFNWEYEHCQKFLKSGHFKIEKSTDI